MITQGRSSIILILLAGLVGRPSRNRFVRRLFLILILISLFLLLSHEGGHPDIQCLLGEIKEPSFLLLIDEEIDLDLLLLQVVLTPHDEHHAGYDERQSQTGHARSEYLNAEQVIDGDSDDGFEAAGDIPNERGEDLIDQEVANDEIEAKYDGDVEDVDEVLPSEEAEDPDDWIEGEFISPEEVPDGD